MARDVQEVFDGLPTRVSLRFARFKPGDGEEAPPAEVVVVFAFSERGFGFGEVTLKQTPEGVFLDTECMSAERCKKYLSALVDSAIADTEDDPDKHALYNRVMGRRCAENCAACASRKEPET